MSIHTILLSKFPFYISVMGFWGVVGVVFFILMEKS